PQQSLCIRTNGNELPVADVGTKRIEVAIQESTFSIVEHIKRFGLIGLHSGDRLIEHGPRFVGSAELTLLCERRGRQGERRGRYHTDCVRASHWLTPKLVARRT